MARVDESPLRAGLSARVGSDAPASLSEVSAACAQLKEWLLDDAYPMWWVRGADRVHGGFHERLRQSGEALAEPRRARLHPRQIYAYSIADDLGWDGPSAQAVEHGLRFFLAHYPRHDHFYRALVAADGTPISEGAILYDQACALFGLAAAFDALDQEHLRDTARDLLTRVRAQFAHAGAGFDEGDPRISRLSSNSHMHLLEAALAWMQLDHHPEWRKLAAEIVELALTRFRDPRDGQIREFFAREWGPAPGVEGSIVEPGHQFEWAWLLMRWGACASDGRATSVGLCLIELAENCGVDRRRGVAVSAVLANGAVHNSQARLWPQTERLKAACIAAETTRSPHYWSIAAQAARALLRYLDTPLRGLWYDTMHVNMTFVDQPAPASSFYHIVGAIAELEHTLNRAAHIHASPE